MLWVHFEVHRVVEARVRVADHLVPMEEPTLAQRYVCWFRWRGEHMVGVNHRAIDPSSWLIEICATWREKCRARLSHHVLAREDLGRFHGRLLFVQAANGHVGGSRRLTRRLEQLIYWLEHGGRVCSRQLVLMVIQLLRCHHPL